MKRKFEELLVKIREICDIEAAGRVLQWDQATYMPPGGAAARARQGATLAGIAHGRITDPAFGRLLDDLAPLQSEVSPNSFEGAAIWLARDKFDKASRVPSKFMERAHRLFSECYEAWLVARKTEDFSAVEPFLRKAVDISREFSEFHAGHESIVDPLIDLTDPGMTASVVSKVFTELRSSLVPLVRAISESEPPEDGFLRIRYDPDKQWELGLEIIKRLGYDLRRGRKDRTVHPFMDKFSIDDVRITTRIREFDLADSLSSTIHETGHALYEQGMDKSFEGTFLAEAPSAGFHESQSRLWENMVGKSLDAWRYLFPLVREFFPAETAGRTAEDFYRGMNRVAPSLIRTEADEVTYNLHVMIRFDLAKSLLEGTLDVKDLPDAWNARYVEDLGVEPRNLKEGALQDVHWYNGFIGGAFQCYTLGNIMAAQIFEIISSDIPELSNNLEKGDFATLLQWLTKHIYSKGSLYRPLELLREVTGDGLETGPLVAYLSNKYGRLYNL